MGKSYVFGFVLLVSFLVFLSASEALTLRGPELVDDEVGHTACGLVIMADEDVTLISVHYPNQGYEDVVELYDDGGVLLASVNIPSGDTDATVVINFPLSAGFVYRLVSQTMSNRKFTPFPAHPVTNSKLTVLSGIMDGGDNTAYWMSFDELRTGPVKKHRH